MNPRRNSVLLVVLALLAAGKGGAAREELEHHRTHMPYVQLRGVVRRLAPLKSGKEPKECREEMCERFRQ